MNGMVRFLKKVWVADASMGYGHQRAAFALRNIAKGGTSIHADQYPGMPDSDKRIWQASRNLYETVSRFKNIPVLGDMVFGMFDTFQDIEEFYPKNQPIEHPTLQLKQIYGFLKNKKWGRHFIEKLEAHSGDPIPLVCTFPAVAFMAEYWGYEGTIWLVVTDSDVSRAWAPMKPWASRIKYFSSTAVSKERLLRYGIPQRNIFDVGFPLPLESTQYARKDLERRIQALDPDREYLKIYSDVVKRYVHMVPPKKRVRPLLTFAIGGAGAQEDIAKEVLKSLTPLLRRKELELCFAVGLHRDIAQDLKTMAKKLGASSSVRILHSHSLQVYFKDFSKLLRETDVLWTKPSELIFYGALGIPLLLSPPVGFQEIRNQEWLVSIGTGITQLEPELCHEWIPDFLYKGRFAEAAMQGYLEMERQGALHITNILNNS